MGAAPDDLRFCARLSDTGPEAEAEVTHHRVYGQAQTGWYGAESKRAFSETMKKLGAM